MLTPDAPLSKERIALDSIRSEIALLFPNPRRPLFQDAQNVVSSHNEANATCILKIMLYINSFYFPQEVAQ